MGFPHVIEINWSCL